LVLAEESALPEEVIHKGRLAVVYVRDNSDIAHIRINLFLYVCHGAGMVACGALLFNFLGQIDRV
jgi:hypothetical protein